MNWFAGGSPAELVAPGEWDRIRELMGPLDYAGYAIVALFVGSWLVALLVWKLGNIEERWSANLAP